MNKHYTARNKTSNLVLIKVEKPASIWGCFTGKNKWSDLMKFHKCKLNIDIDPSDENNRYSMLQAKKKVVFKVVRKPQNRKNSCDQEMSNQYCQNIKEVMREVMCCKSNTPINNNNRSKSAYTLRSKQTDSIIVKAKVSQYNTKKQKQYEVYRNKKTKRNKYIKRSSMIAKQSSCKRDHGGSGDKIESTTSYSSNETEKEFLPFFSSTTSKDSDETNQQVITSKEKMIELLSTKVKGLEQIVQSLQSKNITETKKSMTGNKHLSKKYQKFLNSSNKTHLNNETVYTVDCKSHTKTKTGNLCNTSDTVVEPVTTEKHPTDCQMLDENNKWTSKKHDSVVRIINEPMKTVESSSDELHIKNINEIKFIDTEKASKNNKILVKKYTFKINQNLEESNGNSLLTDDISSSRKPHIDKEKNNFENGQINYDVKRHTIQCSTNACKTKHITENTNLQMKGKKHKFNELIQKTSKSKHECKLHNDYNESKESCNKNSKHTLKTKYNIINNDKNTSVLAQSKNLNYEEVSKRLKHTMKINTDDQLHKNKCLPQIEVKAIEKIAKENVKIKDRLAEKKNHENGGGIENVLTDPGAKKQRNSSEDSSVQLMKRGYDKMNQQLQYPYNDDKTEAQNGENKSNLSIHIFIDENNTFQQAIAECSIIEKSNIKKNQNVHAVSTFSQKATNIKMDSLNMGNTQVQNLYGSCLQQRKINTYKNEHAIILNSCFPNQYFNNQKMLQSISLYNNSTRNTSSDIKSNKTIHEVKSEHTVQYVKTDFPYQEFFNGAKPEYMDSEGRKQFELNQKTVRKRIPLCRKPIQYFEITNKHGCSCQCNVGNRAVKTDITQDRYDSKEMMKDIKAIQLNDCKEIGDKVELYRKFKQIIDKHRERKVFDSGNPQVINHSAEVSTSDKTQDDVKSNSNNIDDHTDHGKTAGINKINCFKCNASTTSVAVQTNDEHVVRENMEAILSQEVHPIEISKKITNNSLLKQGSYLKSQISSPTDVSIKNSYFTSGMIPVTSQISFNTNFIGKKVQTNEAERKTESKNRFMDNQTNLTKHIPSRTRKQSTSRFHRTHTKGMPICFPLDNISLKTSSVFYITSKENNSIVHYIIENLLFEISENLIKKLDKDQFENHLDPLLRASTQYNFHSKVLNNHFSQSTILDELITKFVEEFNTLRTENLFKLIILLLDSVCEMLYDNYF